MSLERDTICTSRILLYAGHRATALPLVSPREKVRLILQMQPKQTKPVVPASLQQFGAIEEILVSPTRKSNKSQQHQCGLLGLNPLTPSLWLDLSILEKWRETPVGAGIRSCCEAGCSGLKHFQVSVFSCTHLRFTAVLLSLYLHVQRTGSEDRALEAKTVSYTREKRVSRMNEKDQHTTKAGGDTSTTPGRAGPRSPAALFLRKS